MKTLALVIGNNNYYDGAKLTNAVRDATAITQVFKRLGFKVMSKYDCNSDCCSVMLDEFEKSIKYYDASIFYFAGHGFELEGENYLANIDCEIPPPDKYHAGRNSIRLSEILDIHRKNYKKTNIAIIDACRKSFGRSGIATLAPVFAPRGTIIAFSTSINESASDMGFEDHSIYTGALLKYIGRERLSIEELFKKVRKTVFNLSGGKQTTWEYTSLINDYYFNVGQLVHSISIPYSDYVVKDANYDESGDFGELIMATKSYNWHQQNPAIDKLLRISASDLNKNQQFILGRNLLQTSGSAFRAINFMESINLNILRYNNNGENHVLNGILFEIYFDSYGEFRMEKTKKYFFEEILNLRKYESLKNSFDFIRNLILNTGYQLIYIPKSEDEYIDVDVVASTEFLTGYLAEETISQVISSIKYNGYDITNKLMLHNITGSNEQGLKIALSDFFTAPEKLIQINSNIQLNNISFNKIITEDLQEI